MKYSKEIAKLTTKKLLMYLVKSTTPFFAADRLYRSSVNKLIDEIECEQIELSQRIKYLKEMGYIETFTEGKEKYIEVTRKGIFKLEDLQKEITEIKRPKKWDGRWRLVLFDIPDEEKHGRNYLRRKLVNLGFLKVQESVYVFPFECSDEIDRLVARNSLERYVLIMIAEAIRNEEMLIHYFINKQILNKADLKK